jgi:hypothetical protein
LVCAWLNGNFRPRGLHALRDSLIEFWVILETWLRLVYEELPRLFCLHDEEVLDCMSGDVITFEAIAGLIS